MIKYILLLFLIIQNSFAKENCKPWKVRHVHGLICQLPNNPKCFALDHYKFYTINCDPELTILFNNLP